MKRTWWLPVALVFTIGIALCVGRYGTDIHALMEAIFLQKEGVVHALVWNLRLPRIVLVCISGAALAVSGIIFQTVFQNPLASGDVIGASSGCSLGAAAAILLSLSSWGVEISAFIGGLCSVILTFLLASRIRGNRILNLVIAGLILQAVTTSLMMGLKIIADPQTQLAGIEYWLMGGFSDANWQGVILSLGICIPTLCLLYGNRWKIQQLAYGEEAKTLGIHVPRIRTLALVGATLLVSSVISVAGIVSWVGLLIPHVLRLAYRKPLSNMMGVTMVSGALFLLVCDTLARSITSIEIPISILTSLAGALTLLVLFVKGRLHV